MSEPAVPEPSSGPIADLPSGEPIPSSAAVPAPKPKPLPIGALLAAAPSNIDAFLARLNKCLSTPSGIDTVFLFICYTSRLSASVLTSLSNHALRRSAREWIALIATLPPKTTILFATDSNLPSTAAAAAALLVAQRLKALAGLLSEARMIMRLWGLLGMYFWGRGLVLKALAARKARQQASEEGVKAAPAETALDTTIAWTQFLTCVAYQVLENGAYLSSKGIMGWTPATQGKAFKWSTRFWGMYVGVELGRLAAEAFKGHEGISAQEKKDKTDAWRKLVARNLSWAPLTVHWSIDKGFVSEGMIGLLGSIPGIIQMRELWAQSA